MQATFTHHCQRRREGVSACRCSRREGASALKAALLAAAALMLALALPTQAFALSTTQCSARPNAESTNDVMGGKATRITWQAMLSDDDQVVEVVLTLPEGTEFGIDSSRVTLLTGDDLMTRVDTGAELSSDGQRVVATFPEAVAQGALRIEVYDVTFPVSGGTMQVTGTYVTADGATHDIGDIPEIAVVGVNPATQLSSWLEQQAWVQAWNSNDFLRLFFNPPLIVTSIPVVFQGFLMAIAIVALAFPLAIPVGLVLALMRMSAWRVLRGIATTYVNVVRGTPLFLQIYIAFFGLPLAGIQVPTYPLGVAVLLLNSAAYLCEIFRAGIQSIPKGQFEASRSLGMNGAQTMIYVIIPQTIRRVIPTMTSEFILLYKDTSLLAAVGTWEMVFMAKTVVASTGSITPYIVAALFYLVITLPLAKVVGGFEARLAGTAKPKKRKRGAGKPAAGGEAQGARGLATDALTAQPLVKSDHALSGQSAAEPK